MSSEITGREYGNDIPQFIHNRPKHFINHCMHRIALTNDIAESSQECDDIYHVTVGILNMKCIYQQMKIHHVHAMTGVVTICLASTCLQYVNCMTSHYLVDTCQTHCMNLICQVRSIYTRQSHQIVNLLNEQMPVVQNIRMPKSTMMYCQEQKKGGKAERQQYNVAAMQLKL